MAAKKTRKQRGRGAPRKPPDKIKASSLLVRLEVVEKQAFTEAADLCGQALSVWVRDQLRRAAEAKLRESGREVPFSSFQPSKDGR